MKYDILNSFFFLWLFKEWPPCVTATLSHQSAEVSPNQASQTMGDISSSSSSTRLKSQAMASANCEARTDSEPVLRHPCASQTITVDGWTSTLLKTFGLIIEPLWKELSSTEVQYSCLSRAPIQIWALSVSEA